MAREVGNSEARDRPPRRGIVTLAARRRPAHALYHAAARCHPLPSAVRFPVTKIRRGGYIFVTWSGDHAPRHVHVYRDGRLVAKWDLEEWRLVSGTQSQALLRTLRDLREEGRL